MVRHLEGKSSDPGILCSWALLLCCQATGTKYVFISNLEHFFYVMTTEFLKMRGFGLCNLVRFF